MTRTESEYSVGIVGIPGVSYAVARMCKSQAPTGRMVMQFQFIGEKVS